MHERDVRLIAELDRGDVEFGRFGWRRFSFGNRRNLAATDQASGNNEQKAMGGEWPVL